MFRASWKYILVGTVAVLALTAVSQSFACCGPWYGFGIGYGCGCNSCGCGGHWCAVGCTPCCDTGSCPNCGSCNWHGGSYGYGWGWARLLFQLRVLPRLRLRLPALLYARPGLLRCWCGSGHDVPPVPGTPTPAVKPAAPPAPGEPATTAPTMPATPPAPTTPATPPAPRRPPRRRRHARHPGRAAAPTTPATPVPELPRR